ENAWVIERVVEAAALVPAERAADDEVGDLDEVAKFDEVRSDSEVSIIILHLLAEHVDPVLCALEPLGCSNDAYIVPHETPDFAPGLGYHDFLIAVGHAAFIPRTDLRDLG